MHLQNRWDEFSFHALKKKKKKKVASFINMHWPVEWIIDLSVHDHGFKHGTLTHNKLDHSMDEREQIPTRKTQLKRNRFSAINSHT